MATLLYSDAFAWDDSSMTHGLQVQQQERGARIHLLPPRFDPPLERWPDRGVYQLWIRLAARIRLSVGRLGRFTFPAGTYVYTGRAARGLQARVRRHVKGARRQHWHIDYLLASSHARIDGVVLAACEAPLECMVNQGIGRYGGLVTPGFGASDCSSGCGAHLWLLDGAPRREHDEAAMRSGACPARS